MDNIEFRLNTYNFSAHIAKVDWDPWDQPIIQLRNGQSYAITLAPGQDPTRIRNISKADWGDIARRIDTILTNKGIWEQGPAALPMHQNFDNLVINQNGVTWNNGQTIAHAIGTNTLADYQAMSATVRQRLALPPAAAAPAPAPVAQGALPVAPQAQQPVAAAGGVGIPQPDIRQAVARLVAREIQTVSQRNPGLEPRLQALLGDACRQQIATTAGQLSQVRGIDLAAIQQCVNECIDESCFQQFKTELESDITKELRRGNSNPAQAIAGAYNNTLRGLPNVPVKARLAQLLERERLQGMILVCAERQKGIFRTLAGHVSSLGGAAASASGKGGVQLAKTLVVGGGKLGVQGMIGLGKMGVRWMLGRPVLGGAPAVPAAAPAARNDDF